MSLLATGDWLRIAKKMLPDTHSSQFWDFISRRHITFLKTVLVCECGVANRQMTCDLTFIFYIVRTRKTGLKPNHLSDFIKMNHLCDLFATINEQLYFRIQVIKSSGASSPFLAFQGLWTVTKRKKKKNSFC